MYIIVLETNIYIYLFIYLRERLKRSAFNKIYFHIFNILTLFQYMQIVFESDEISLSIFNFWPQKETKTTTTTTK